MDMYIKIEALEKAFIEAISVMSDEPVLDSTAADILDDHVTPPVGSL